MATKQNQVELLNHNPSHHVKFNIEEEEFKSHHENVEIHKESDYEYNINLGYLKVDHYYKLKFNLDLSKITSQSSSIDYLVHKSSRHLSFKEIKMDDNINGMCSFSLIFHAFKEKVDIEKAYFSLSGSDDTNLVINFEAKVLGAHQG